MIRIIEAKNVKKSWREKEYFPDEVCYHDSIHDSREESETDEGGRKIMT